MFEAFVQLGKRTSIKGTGLGLTVIRQFVSLMGGTIEVASVLGEGSRFRFAIPVELEEKEELKNVADEDDGRIIRLAPGQAERRVLTVDR